MRRYETNTAGFTYVLTIMQMEILGYGNWKWKFWAIEKCGFIMRSKIQQGPRFYYKSPDKQLAAWNYVELWVGSNIMKLLLL